MRERSDQHEIRTRQRGVAAIEFAFVLISLLLFLYGIATVGLAIYTQHVLTRSAEDGARVISLFVNPTEGDVRLAVLESMSSPWKNVSGLQVTSPMNTNPVVVTITYPYENNALLPSLPLTAGWMIPKTLRARAAATKPSP